MSTSSFFLSFFPSLVVVVLTDFHRYTEDEGIAVYASNTPCDLDDEEFGHDHACICLSTGPVASLFALLMQNNVSGYVVTQLVSRSPARPFMDTALVQMPSVTLTKKSLFLVL